MSRHKFCALASVAFELPYLDITSVHSCLEKEHSNYYFDMQFKIGEVHILKLIITVTHNLKNLVDIIDTSLS